MNGAVFERWRRLTYRRTVAAAFRTVPLYRERWALHGRTDPVLVPGRTGVAGGALRADEARHRIADLVPLAGGSTSVDPWRGLRRALSIAGCPRTVTVLRDDADAPEDLDAGPQGHTVVGPPELLARMAESSLAAVTVLPMLTLSQLTTRTEGSGLLHDPLLGFLGARRGCGHWHLDWSHVHGRNTDAGVAVTLLRQRSPRLVDVLIEGAADAVVTRCPVHGSPVITA